MENAKQFTAPLTAPPRLLEREHAYDRFSHQARSEVDSFYKCTSCGQTVDRRSVYQVLYHEEGGHDPMSELDLAQTTPIDIER